MKMLYLTLALAMLAGCSSSTVIRASDPDARIFVNGEYVGTGVATYSDRKVAFSRNDVVIRKEGCTPAVHHFRRNEKPRGGAIVGAILVTVPVLWVTGYKGERNYEYDCNPGGGSEPVL